MRKHPALFAGPLMLALAVAVTPAVAQQQSGAGAAPPAPANPPMSTNTPSPPMSNNMDEMHHMHHHAMHHTAMRKGETSGDEAVARLNEMSLQAAKNNQTFTPPAASK